MDSLVQSSSPNGAITFAITLAHGYIGQTSYFFHSYCKWCAVNNLIIRSNNERNRCAYPFNRIRLWQDGDIVLRIDAVDVTLCCPSYVGAMAMPCIDLSFVVSLCGMWIILGTLVCFVLVLYMWYVFYLLLRYIVMRRFVGALGGVDCAPLVCLAPPPRPPLLSPLEQAASYSICPVRRVDWVAAATAVALTQAKSCCCCAGCPRRVTAVAGETTAGTRSTCDQLPDHQHTGEHGRTT